MIIIKNKPLIYLDTNILIALVDGKCGFFGESYDFFKFAQDLSPSRFVTSIISYSECLVKPCAENNNELIELYRKIFNGFKFFRYIPIDPSTTVSLQESENSIPIITARLRAAYSTLKLPDAIHVATALKENCDYFLTGDKRLINIIDDIKSRNKIINKLKPIEIELKYDVASLLEKLKNDPAFCS
jgi:predicted nucleic acid-binding protein